MLFFLILLKFLNKSHGFNNTWCLCVLYVQYKLPPHFFAGLGAAALTGAAFLSTGLAAALGSTGAFFLGAFFTLGLVALILASAFDRLSFIFFSSIAGDFGSSLIYELIKSIITLGFVCASVCLVIWDENLLHASLRGQDLSHSGVSWRSGWRRASERQRMGWASVVLWCCWVGWVSSPCG